MKNINIIVKQFKKENKVIFSTWHKLLHIAKKSDWNLKPYSKAKKQGHNRLYTISHEIGHIYLGHTTEIEKSESEEIESDEFAELLLTGHKKIFSCLKFFNACYDYNCFLLFFAIILPLFNV